MENTFKKTSHDRSFNFRNYEQKGRFISYWHQVSEIINLAPKSILEVGIGSRFLYNYIKKQNCFKICSVDIDKTLSPDIIGSILYLPIESESYDCVVCFQTLEHIPFEEFSKGLKELKRVSRKWLIISIPDRRKFFNLVMDFRYFKIINRSFNINFSVSIWSEKHKFDGEHYWEIGKKGYSLSAIKKHIENLDLKIIKSYRVVEKPLHHFFVLEKTGNNS